MFAKRSAAEIAWVAGMFEGEGSLSIVRPANNPRIQLSSTDQDVIERIQQIVGAGTVCHSPKGKGGAGTKPIWTWYLNRIVQIWAFMETIEPWLGKRRLENIKRVRLETDKNLLCGICQQRIDYEPRRGPLPVVCSKTKCKREWKNKYERQRYAQLCGAELKPKKRRRRG